MSDNDRMERAKRIREMREGQRDDEESDDEEATADGGEAPEPSEPDTESASDSTPNTESDTESGGDTTATIPSVDKMEAALEETMEQAEPVAETDVDVDQSDTDVEETDVDVEDEAEGGDEDEAEGGDEDEVEGGDEDEAEGGDEDDESEEADQTEGAGPAGVAGETATHEEETRVLEFQLDDEQYCLDIEYIEEIVKHENITRVPNTPEFVEGVVDLRGQITTILNPKVTIDKDDQSAGDLIVVFDSEAFDDQGHIGWVVDDVRQVSPVTDDQVNDPPMGEEYINGVIDREGEAEFVIWTTPNLALEEAE
jgi:purine-binding chemotaxis protein CheW